MHGSNNGFDSESRHTAHDFSSNAVTRSIKLFNLSSKRANSALCVTRRTVLFSSGISNESIYAISRFLFDISRSISFVTILTISVSVSELAPNNVNAPIKSFASTRSRTSRLKNEWTAAYCLGNSHI